jgi:hypothetical protein
MLKIILFHFRTAAIEITIEARFEGENLVIEGYDIGKTVEEAWGDSDYEYSLTIQPQEVEKLYPLLDVELFDKQGLLYAIEARFNTNTCYSEFRSFLDKNNIKAVGFSWT